MSSIAVGSAASSATTQNLSPLAAQKAAHAKYLKTGIDKDASIGDPDHDGAGKKASVTGPSGQSVASAVPTVNAAALQSGGTAGSASGAYGRATGKAG